MNILLAGHHVECFCTITLAQTTVHLVGAENEPSDVQDQVLDLQPRTAI